MLKEAEPDAFTARATDLETWVSQATKVAQVERPGQALVNAERLLSVAKEMTDDALWLETVGEHLHVRGARSQFKLLAMKPDAFPPFPDNDRADNCADSGIA